ncbi:hypothetical protein Tco_0184385 [Tanacetum coccineum]
METKDTLSSCSDLDKQEIQRMQKQAKILKENSMNKFHALNTTIQHISNHDFPMNFTFKRELHPLFEVKASDASSGDKDSSGIVSDKGNDQRLENQSNTYGNESKCKSSLKDSNGTRDRCIIAFNDKEIELAKYKRFNDCTLKNDSLECKLKDTLGLLAQKEINLKEVLKTKGYEIWVEKEKNKIVDLAWERHTHDQFRPPTNQDMNVLLKNLLVPLALKTKNDACQFDCDLKQEMFADLQYVQSLEKEVGELESDKADLSKEFDLLLQECVSKDVMCYLYSLADIDEQTELQSLYLDKIEEYLKAQLQDKNIAISKLKKLIKKMKGKDVDTTFEKPSILGKPPLQAIRNQPVSPKESVGSNDMVHNYYLEEAKKKAQLQKDKALNPKPSVITPARLPNTINGSKPKPSNSNQKPFLKSKDLACPTCKKCIYSANHDECILKYLSKVNSRINAQKKDAPSNKTTKRYIPVENKSDSKKHDRQIPIGQKFSLNKSSAMYLKTTPPRSGLTWNPTGRIFTYVGLRFMMDDPNITMEEYIKLQAEKAQWRGQTFNWETVTYGMIYCDNLDFCTDFEADFPAIVYNDALASNENVSSEPTINMALLPRDQRHFFLKFKRLEYTDADITDFEDRGRVCLPAVVRDGYLRLEDHWYMSLSWSSLEHLGSREFTLAMGLHTTEKMESARFGTYWADSARQIPNNGDLSAYWRGISSKGDFLGSVPSYTTIRDPMLRLCHRLIACSIAGRSQTPEKVTSTNLLYLQGIPEIRRQPVAMVGGPEIAKGAPNVDEGAQAVPAPVQAPQPPLVAAPTSTMAHRLSILEEEVHSLRGDMGMGYDTRVMLILTYLIRGAGSDKGLERPAL